MQVQAISRNVRISPRKARLVADAVRALPVADAIVSLHAIKKRAAQAIRKTLESAISNATNNAKLDKNSLRIADIEVADGQAIKRYHPSTRGRIHPYKKRSSHIRVVLEEKKGETKKVESKEKSNMKTKEVKLEKEAKK